MTMNSMDENDNYEQEGRSSMDTYSNSQSSLLSSSFMTCNHVLTDQYPNKASETIRYKCSGNNSDTGFIKETKSTCLNQRRRRRKSMSVASSLCLTILIILLDLCVKTAAFQTSLQSRFSLSTSTCIALSASSSSSQDKGDKISRTTSATSPNRKRKVAKKRTTITNSAAAAAAKKSTSTRTVSSSKSSPPKRQKHQQDQSLSQKRHFYNTRHKKQNQKKKAKFSIQQHISSYPQHASLFDSMQELKNQVYQTLSVNDKVKDDEKVANLSFALDAITNQMMPLLDTLDEDMMLGEINGINGEQQTVNGYNSTDATTANKAAKVGASMIVDETLQLIYNQAFVPPYEYTSSFHRAKIGSDALKLQLQSKNKLIKPYDLVKRSTLLHALRAFTSVSPPRPSGVRVNGEKELPFQPLEESFRLLQRLITGRGVRYSPQLPLSYADDILHSSLNKTKDIMMLAKMPVLDERDFNMVLNSYINNRNLNNNGNMNMAHRLIALQERLYHAPPLSAVPFSIMLKGYGKLRDVHNIEMTLSHAKRNDVKPDIVMMNSIIDAHVNCDLMEEALSTFSKMKKNAENNDDEPKPNIRTYNTILKGLAKNGDIMKALRITEEMSQQDIWDDVTTNSLVNAAVCAHEFDTAEKILMKYTNRHPSSTSSHRRGQRRRQQHPNVEAYTELLDGYAKAGMLEKALHTLQVMRKRNVHPNEYTYTCMVGALARANRISQAKKMISFMLDSDENVRPITATYNALITGMLTHDDNVSSFSDEEDEGVNGDSVDNRMKNKDSKRAYYDSRVKDALSVLNEMIHSNVTPNAITASALVDALGRCHPSHVKEAKELVSQLDHAGYVPSTNARVSTALIRTCAAANDILGAEEAFRRIQKPDVVALNAFLDACTKCDQLRLAFHTFDLHVCGNDVDAVEKNSTVRSVSSPPSSNVGWRTDTPENEQWRIRPDVITYSVLITALLKINSATAAKRAQSLYDDMKRDWDIMPDKALVDTILTAMVGGGGMGLEQSDIEFTLTVLRDAEKLDWEPDQLRKRKKVVRGVIVGRMSEVWKEDENAYGMDTEVDPLFQRKGWNKVDSGFRLWGGGISENPQQKARSNKSQKGDVDEFLESKGWNDVDSGFRIL